MPNLRTPDLYDQVRKALDVSLTATSLPDDVIDLPIYAGAARDQVLAAQPDAESLDPVTDAARWQAALAALAYLTAARLAPALPQVTTRQVGDVRVSREKWDAAAAEARLRKLAAGSLAILTGTVAGERGTAHFWVVPGRRGR